jgi:heme-degrading monooxygenase HmoA
VGEPADPAFVVSSEVHIADAGTGTLERAFQDRLGAVDGWPGCRRLEVWRDLTRAGVYLMVSWWDSREDFSAYMRSDAHRRSHERIPEEPRPSAAGVRRWEVVAE